MNRLLIYIHIDEFIYMFETRKTSERRKITFVTIDSCTPKLGQCLNECMRSSFYDGKLKKLLASPLTKLNRA